MRALRGAVWLSVALFSVAADGSSTAEVPFWSHWGDGKAEVSSYRLERERYGEPRPGTAVAIFVTETFSESGRVKATPGHGAAHDEFPVMKLNLIRDFQTGIYAYHTMTSAFVDLVGHNGRRPGAPAKVSFSSQEWCGQTYAHWIAHADHLMATQHSYFEEEGDAKIRLDHPSQALYEDTWLMDVRNLGPRERGGPTPGEHRVVPVLPSLDWTRLNHRPLAWTLGAWTRHAHSEVLQVPAGRFEVERHSLLMAEGRLWTVWVETKPPRRIIRWENLEESAELTGSQRIAYWKLTGPGDGSALEGLGLARPPAGAAGGYALPHGG